MIVSTRRYAVSMLPKEGSAVAAEDGIVAVEEDIIAVEGES